MTGDQIRFQLMVEQYPTLAPYWDFEKREVKVKTADDLPVSSGEKILMAFSCLCGSAVTLILT